MKIDPVAFIKRNLWTIVAFSVLIGIVLYQRIPLWQQQSKMEGREAPAVSFYAMDGKEVKLSQQSLRNQVTVLSFWATWCVPCKVESPVLESIYENLKSGPFAMYAISAEEPRLVRDYAKEKGLAYPVFTDITGEAHSKFGVRGYPAIIVIDPDGRIAHMSTGIDFLVKWKVERMTKALKKRDHPDES